MTGLAFVSLSSCIDETIDGDKTNENTIYLKLSTGASSTRADGTSQPSLNEDKIDRVDIYLFPAGSNTDCVHKTFETTNTYGSTTASFQLVEDEINKIFPSEASTCDMYLYVNLPGQTATSLESKSQTQYGEATVNSLTDFRKSGAPDNFIMQAKDGKLSLGYNKSTRQFTTSQTDIRVKRIASKIRLAVNPSEFIYTDEAGNSLTADEAKAMEAKKVHTYALASDRNIRVFLYNGVSLGRLDGTIPSDLSSNESNYFDIPVVAKGENGYELSRTVQSDKPNAPTNFPYYNEIPFYSYPNKWENTSSETHRTYMILQIVWNEYNMYVDEDTPTTSSGPKVTYYSVPVTSSSTLEANHYYTVNLNVSMVGGSSSQEAVELTGDCSIEDWVNSDDINVSIKDARFLIVDSEWDMGADESIEIPFLTSHPVTFKAVQDGITVKVHYSQYSAQSTTVTIGSQNIFTSSRVDYWGSGSGTLTGSSAVLEHTYTDTQNNNSKSQNNEEKKLYDYSINNSTNILTFNHQLRGLDLIGGTTDATATGFKENGKEDKRGYDIEIIIVHSDMVGTPDEDKWTRHIYINQAARGISVSIIPRLLENTTSLSFTGSYGMWTSLVFLNNNSLSNIGYTSSPDFFDYFGGFGITYNELDNRNTSTYDEVSRDLYVFTVSSAIDDNFNFTSTTSDIDRDDAERQRLQKLNELTKKDKTITFADGSTQTYIIGDPRTTFVNNNLGGFDALTGGNNTLWSSPAPASGLRTDPFFTGESDRFGNPETNTGQIAYYYPTREDEEATNIIAPKFMVSSSFGKVITELRKPDGTLQYSSDGIDRETARRRCAVYQELYYPAGRWRLPTKSEFELIGYLQQAGDIMTILAEKDEYWTANGIYKLDSNGKAQFIKPGTSSSDQALVRCVYDLWYWTDKSNSYYSPDDFKYSNHNFVWGDREITR